MTVGEAYIENEGEKWFLRDFDFFPEKLSHKFEIDKYYDSYNFIKGIEKKQFIVFNSEIDAIEASIEIRQMFGLDCDSLKEKLMDIKNGTTSKK